MLRVVELLLIFFYFFLRIALFYIYIFQSARFLTQSNKLKLKNVELAAFFVFGFILLLRKIYEN
jgi:hypothetical protein